MKHKHSPLIFALSVLATALIPPALHALAESANNDLEGLLDTSAPKTETNKTTAASTHDLNEAFSKCRTFLSQLSSDPILQGKSRLQMLRTLLAKGEAEPAEDLARTVTGPQSGQAWGILGYHFATNQQPVNAARCLKTAQSAANAQLGWKRDRTLIEIAATQEALGLSEQSEQTLSKVTEELHIIRAKSRVAEAKAKRTGDPSFEIIHLENLPENYLQEAAAQSQPFFAAASYWIEKKDLDRARSLLLKAAEVATSAHNNTQIAPSIAISEKLSTIGFQKEADSILQSAIGTAESLSENAYWKTRVFARIAAALQKKGETARAIQMLEEAASFPEKLPRMDQPQALVSLAEAWLSLGREDMARDWWVEAARTAKSNPNRRMRAHGAFLVSLSHASSDIPFSDGLRTHINTIE